MARRDTNQAGEPVQTNPHEEPVITYTDPEDEVALTNQPAPNDEPLLPTPDPNTMPSGGTAPQVSTDTPLDRRLLAGATDTRAPQIDIDPTAGLSATTREVQDNELVSHQLEALLRSDSPYMRQARMQGLSLGGGLGGTAGIRASMGAAIAAGLPIAQADAQAFRDAATQNMNALNQFTLATMQRVTTLETANLDAATRIKTTAMNNSLQAAVAKLNSLTQREIANLDAQTQVHITELNGQIQARLADLNYQYNTLLNDQQNAARLEQIAVQGEYNLANTELQADVARETNYIQAVMQSYNAALDRIEALNGLEMDDAARARAQSAIWEGAAALFDLVNNLYPEQPPITFPTGE